MLACAAQAFGPTYGVFDPDAAAGVGAVFGPLRVGEGREWLLFAALGLVVGQALRGHIVVSHQAQVI